MIALFRADASVKIGSGHVMRCLTLASTLRSFGVHSTFLCRNKPGQLTELIKARGFEVILLPEPSKAAPKAIGRLAHSAWLGCTQQEDADACVKYLADFRPHWLIVDHYALDEEWHHALRMYYRKLMVIDDLADRSHLCDLLLDQNLGRKEQDYHGLVPESAQVLTGPSYALLRQEFVEWRARGSERRNKLMTPQRILVTLGGADAPNATTKVIESLASTVLAANAKVTVVMGTGAPWLDLVRNAATQSRFEMEVLVNVENMAALMADADICVGAAGSTSWERCCLGLPTLLLITAANQRFIAQNLEFAGAAISLDVEKTWSNDDFVRSFNHLLEPETFARMSNVASGICDGLGTQRVGEILLG
ncbi:UDP-2,4-diacetamido-2,4,6-trideoxy-beta-L-altropyranose hydrolase [Pseudomonas guariconensis]|uniref:UDP-2,4-diacetamido-2,4, 6-trideoxy-beta-L-altropyranose hydrolase n=1 Tax=Pseudomonas guariconensis TaxID=1288410 RepID=UPI0018D68233|nr:UDP-2,4-diacetamido-2,4,6-trideoxy-beta-L-altropyranose hydrolase [Pseudomonas guariconensis]MBH3359060.1 UDP-2,4-diacetamido-2,4,6-trideoxy-beta-L-altropyranose hydrolase [Pseudomonas guariconensis]MDM9595244.1 UDP-2,4-diacetamido-2,4,6-trideoxy-beta-L-altropyranose hydrolase [Pseudomonas guariconensis]MDM9608073.1 UDP-2,4-diacetamido-2,4,6-trideoxy-beta-L-altropyranose hydrolase [Pseudomonas guariconensis]MDM9613030.1 UDP-2,4-diacetamido-2,4,6-trideoxy-beta-L-altropyranose hydrolase [Pseud